MAKLSPAIQNAGLMPNFRLKKLQIPDSWTIVQNYFMDLEPDNNFPIHAVAEYLVENTMQAKLNGYIIDPGFYGNYR